MKKQIVILILFFVIVSCKEGKDNSSTNSSPNKESSVQKEVEATYTSFGGKITAENSWSKEEMYHEFKSLEKGDTIDVKFSSIISSVCENEGCWIRINLDEKINAIVKFKNQNFAMPTNSKNREVIVSGRAYLNVTTVEEIRQYAKKDGLSKEEIDKITEEEISFAIESDGVLMKE